MAQPMSRDAVDSSYNEAHLQAADCDDVNHSRLHERRSQGAQRMRALAQRCRELSELTALPEVTRELIAIADALESEADLVSEA